MNAEEILYYFEIMQETLEDVQEYQKNKREAYDGDRVSRILQIVENEKIRDVLTKQSSWVRVGVDHLLHDCSFDAFENDTFGLTRLLVDVNIDTHIESAQRNAMIGACSFIAIFPRENSLPVLATYSGAQATGIKELRGDELMYGLAEKDINEEGEVTEYFFFEKGFIHVVNSEGEVIDSVELETDVMALVEFNYDLEIATKPHGSSRISSSAISSLDSSLSSLALMQQAGITNTLKSDLILVNGAQGSFDTTEINGQIDQYKAIFNDSSGEGAVDVKRPSDVNTSSLEKLYNISGYNFATSMGLDPSVLGLESASGSFSEGALAHMSRSYSKIKESTRRGFASSILELAKKVYELTSGDPEVDFGAIGVAFNEPFDVAKLGEVGDAIQKISMIGIEVDQSFINRQLGIPLRPAIAAQGYADFNLSRFSADRYDSLKSAIDEENQSWTIPSVRRLERGSGDI